MANSAFGAAYAGSYDELYSTKDYGTECDLIEEAWRRHAPGPIRDVVDLGCGTGTHAIELARRGRTVTGVDLSEGMLRAANEKLARETAGAKPLPVEFVLGDVGSVNLKRKFDAAIMMFAVLGYQLTNEQVVAALRNVAAHVRPGGPFVCDFWFGPAVLTERPGERVKVLDAAGGRIIRTARTDLDVLRQTATVNYGLWRLKDRQLLEESAEAHEMRYFFPQEIAFFMRVAGLELVSLTAFPSLSQPLSDRTWNAVAVAKVA